MKHNHNHDNAPDTGPQLRPVRFEFTHPTATTVSNVSPTSGVNLGSGVGIDTMCR